MHARNRMVIACDWCGMKFEKCPSVIKRHNFCCRSCLANFSNKANNPNRYHELKNYTGQSMNMAAINRRMNPSRMTVEVRAKLRHTHLRPEHNGRTYAKYYGQVYHRMLAEKQLRRKLRKDEVVHHIDGDRRNNFPENLMVMTKSEHSSLYARLNWFWFRSGVSHV